MGTFLLNLMPKFNPAALRVSYQGLGFLGSNLVRFQSSISNEIRNELKSYPGGSVDLTKDEQSKIATICLNYPEKKNALTGTMLINLMDIISELESWDDGKGLILKGSNGTFCCGLHNDLFNPKLGSAFALNLGKVMQNITQRIFLLPLVSVSFLQGHCLGGGSELSLCTDFRIASEHVALGFTHAKIGLTTGFGGTTFLTDIVGRNTAISLLTTARILSWKEGSSIGLIDAAFPVSSDFITSGTEWLQRHTNHSSEVIHAIKRNINTASQEKDIYVSMEKENFVFSTVFGKAAHRKSLGLE